MAENPNTVYGFTSGRDIERVIAATKRVEAITRSNTSAELVQGRGAQSAFFRITGPKDATGKVWPMILVTRAWAESNDPLVDPATLTTTWIDGDVGYVLEVNDADLVEGDIYGGVIVNIMNGYAVALCSAVASAPISSVAGMARLVNPIELHASGTCVKAFIQKWTNTPVYTPLDDIEVWLRLL